MASVVIPTGALKEAEVPVPFALPLTPLPAKVVTTPAGVIFRSTLLPLSATYTFPNGSVPTPKGPLNEAAVPVPLVNPETPLPAKVVTTPAGVILRIRLFPKSDTYKLPAASVSIPVGLLNEAAVPVPLALPETPLPAKVVTTPAGVIIRIRSLPLSATYTFPAASVPNPKGSLNEAAVPVPLVLPAIPLPAKVLTTPAGVIIRIKLLPKSATKTLPEGSVVIPIGLLNDAAVPVPLALPAAPLPAKVLTIPAGVILRIKLLYKSATYTFPTASLATPIGVLKEAAVPVPLVVPAAPLPANVVTVATELIGSELLITVLHWAFTFAK